MNASPLHQLKRVIIPLVLLSIVTNLAVLVSPIYMMQVLDRVVPSQNLHTLVMLLMVALGFVALQSVVDFVRDGTFRRAARWVEAVAVPCILANGGAAKQDQIGNMAKVTQALQGSIGASMLNLPWLPLFLLVLFLVHPLFLVLALTIIAVQHGVKALGQALQHDKQIQATQLHQAENAALTQSASFFAMAGMHVLSRNLVHKYSGLQQNRHQVEEALTPGIALQSSASGFLRTATQILGLSLGATLVVTGDLTAGGMIAASIILAKTTTTFEATLTALPGFREAFAAYKSLNQLLAQSNPSQTDIPEFSGDLATHKLIIPRGNGAPPRLDQVSFDLKAGECLAIIGASGSGKSSLLLALAGIQPAPIGAVLMDQSDVRTLSHATVAAQVGYLPQQAELFDGTLAQNICAFDPSPADARIVEAAKTAGVHGLISALPGAYDTDIGKDAFLLSAGQKQRVALARAIYADPKYLFLDEPNALLDAEGERQLGDTLARLKSQGTTIVMVIHRSGVMGLADKVLHMDNGKMSDFGPRADVLARFNVGIRRLELPMLPQSQQDLTDWVGRQFVRSGDDAYREKAVLIAAETFNVALANSTSTKPRKGVFEFKFIDDTNCTLSLVESHATLAEQKFAKVEKLMRKPDTNIAELPRDELSLAMLDQLTQAMTIQNVQGGAIFKAAIDKNAGPNLHAGVTH